VAHLDGAKLAMAHSVKLQSLRAGTVVLWSARTGLRQFNPFSHPCTAECSPVTLLNHSVGAH
jgi:hypothetical protein